MENTLTLPITISDLAKVLIFASLSIISFFVPFSLGHPQMLVGIVVNAGLLISAIFLPRNYLLPLIVLPSLGVVARGLLFGPFTYFVVYFMPFVWLGNAVLVFGFRYLFSKFSFIVSTILSATLKFLLLFTVANVYFGLHVVPKMFLQSMGVFQLYTALAGGLIAFIIFYARRNTSN